MADEYETFAARVEKYTCPGHLQLPNEEELKALHRFKLEFAAALRKLYRAKDAEEADKFIRPLLHRL